MSSNQFSWKLETVSKIFHPFLDACWFIIQALYLGLNQCWVHLTSTNNIEYMTSSLSFNIFTDYSTSIELIINL